MSTKRHDHLIKAIMIGESGVGKTALATRFAYQRFIQHHVMTFGIDMVIATLDYQGQRVQFNIWDSTGDIRFETITDIYLKTVETIIIVFDLSNHETFTKVPNWLNRAKSYHASNANYIILGNKADKTFREVSDDEIEEMMTQPEFEGVTYFTVSAKNNDHNVDQVFQAMAKTRVETITIQDQPKIIDASIDPLCDKCHCVVL